VVIDQGRNPTSPESARSSTSTRRRVVIEVAAAALPPSYNIVADSIEKIGDATYRITTGCSRPARCRSPTGPSR
jgi:hypothetical protein